MPDCASLDKCTFFNDQMKDMPSMADMYKREFCRDDFRRCARFRVKRALGKEAVPPDLYPNMDRKADELIGFTWTRSDADGGANVQTSK